MVSLLKMQNNLANLLGNDKAETSEREPDTELKPSMARAPRLKKRVPLERAAGNRAGVDYEVYDPKKHAHMGCFHQSLIHN